ncbi:GNAT family N-acetyltransferase [Filimonas effusa]|uniref:N-acetyltransferase n=1 Tax=Filimonas effusa TaxID=2508721 RepID=A0A4Q1DCY9_9BACT|nr:GNAT family N-acetyltransferase [Filimonas effusa]RXK86513.1 N-acetyltransferase [Filimonas effusa]
MKFNIQPILENEDVILYPLLAKDFDELYAVASDPEVWEQHPNKDRWREDVFRSFFDGAMDSKGAFKIISKFTGEIAGSTRIYDYNEAENSVFVGYTFYGTKYWGKGINLAVKQMMLDYLFKYVSKVYFHVGSFNRRSQIAVERLGAKKIGELSVAYVGEEPRDNYVYVIEKAAV